MKTDLGIALDIPQLERYLFDTFQGEVKAEQCDVMGHLTTKEYLGIFDKAEWETFGKLGFSLQQIERDKVGFADLHHDIHYLSELHVGARVRVRSAVIGVGTKTLKTLHCLISTDCDSLSATLRAVSCQFDLSLRRSIPLLQPLAETARRFCCGSPESP